ncbi:MAG: type II toxin-antitoxin system PemK/MazF family toxin, partial [Candidatus Pacebacteria bacterium]|nr:type II toxin-antitoxin system PemK/MazF family toxin [Candidatus Paceibacterota bacterium]
MDQDYDDWNIIKKELSKKEEKFFFKEGDIWWVSLGKNLGTESYGKGEIFRRPVLIIKKLNSNSCIVLPLTSKNKSGTWFTEITFQNEIKTVLLYQIKMINTKRFQRRLGVLDDNDFKKVKEKLKFLLEL